MPAETFSGGVHIFISYASEDKLIADAMCHALESSGIRCWIAPRDVRPGMEYASEIIDAIAAARALVLVFSSRANESPHVKAEIERAVSDGKAVIPFRVEDVLPTKSLEFFISSRQWLDALTVPLEAHYKRLAGVLNALSGGPVDRTAPPKELPVKTSQEKKVRIVMAAILILGLAAAAVVYGFNSSKKVTLPGVQSAAVSGLPSATPRPPEPAQPSAVPQPTAPTPDRMNEAGVWDRLKPDYLETFDQPDPKLWFAGRDGGWKLGTQKGVYYMTNASSDAAAYFINVSLSDKTDRPFFDAPVSVEVLVAQTKGGMAGAGLLFRFDEKDNLYYAFFYSGKGKYSFYRRGRGGFAPLWAASSDAFKPDGFNKLGITSDGSKMHLFANERLLKTIDDDELKPGVTGIVSLNIGNYCFDNFCIYREPR